MKIKFLVVALTLVLALGMAVPLHAKDPQPVLTIDVQRITVLGAYGAIHVLDNLTIHNNGATPVASLDFAFPRTYRGSVYYADAKDSLGATLLVDSDVNKTSSDFWMRVHFAQALPFNQTYLITVRLILGNMITFAPEGAEFNFTAAPILTQDARVANVTFVGLQGSTFVIPDNSTYTVTKLGALPALFKQYKPWKAYSHDTFYAPYRTVSEYLVAVRSVHRDVILGNTGTLSVKDSYSLHNNGIVISGIAIRLPAGATNVMAYDEVGAMWTTPQSPVSPYQITVQPRYSAGVQKDENFTFTLTYDLPPAKYLKRLSSWGDYNLTFSVLNDDSDFIIDNATMRIVAPNGVNISNDPKTPAQSSLSYPIQYNPNKYEFSLNGVTSLNNLTIGVRLSYSPFWSAYSALPWLVGLEVAIGAVALILKIRRGPELEVPVPVERLREFVGLYDERLALTRELVIMEEEVARGGMVKHEFRRRKKVMELRLDEINRSLMEVKAELRTISQYYDELIRRIDRAEAEIEVSRSSMSQVRGQYRSGRLTRETYDTMVNDIAKRIDRAEETVETSLITLREQAR